MCSYEMVFVHLREKTPDWIRERHPNGFVPILEDYEGRILYESLICAQYADDANPQSRLTPSDPWDKARQMMLITSFDRVYVNDGVESYS
jgi:glutathione S-transferase